MEGRGGEGRREGKKQRGGQSVKENLVSNECPFLSSYISHFEEWWELAKACSFGKEEGRGPSSEAVVEPELEPDAVHLRHSGAEVGRLTTAHRVHLLTQWSHRDQDTVPRRGREGEVRRQPLKPQIYPFSPHPSPLTLLPSHTHTCNSSATVG